MSHPTPADFAALGIVLPAHAGGEVRTTCPQCSASRRKSRDRCLAVNLDEGIFLCWHCGWKGSVSGGESASSSRGPREPAKPDEHKRAQLQKVWRAAHPLLPGDPPMTYLAQRGLLLPANAIPPVLRYHPQLRYAPDEDTQGWTTHPALLARVDGPDGQPVTLHRTYLTSTGHKAEVLHVRKSMAPAVGGASTGAAIRLYRPTEVLAVTEGIETALAVHLSTGLPVWAAICARGMAKLMVPAAVQTLIICADHDANGVGSQAAEELARRLLAEGRHVKILLPERVGTDWLDVYRAPQLPQLTSALIADTPLLTLACFSITLAWPTPYDSNRLATLATLARGGTSAATHTPQGMSTSHGVRATAMVARYKRQLYADPYFGAPGRRAQGIPVARLVREETPHE